MTNEAKKAADVRCVKCGCMPEFCGCKQDDAPVISERDHRALVALCESPIEIRMGAALIAAAGGKAVWVDDPLFDRMAQLLAEPNRTAAIVPQAECWARGKRYRLDFLVVAAIDGKLTTIAVECDGREFHDSTKEQASADRARDRAVQTEGILIARFTGSDIHGDPMACAREVWEMAGLLERPAGRLPADIPAKADTGRDS